MREIHWSLEGDKEARIGFFQITDNQFTGARMALNRAANAHGGA
jgi:hypothetical protein